MKTLLLILLFQLDASGQPGRTEVAQRLFENEQACLDAGAATKAAMPKEILVIATCVPQSAFNGPIVPNTPPAAPAPAPTPAPATPPKGN